MAASLKTALSSAASSLGSVGSVSSVSSSSSSAAAFVPRTIFEVSPSITRSYFLGHHASALASMRKVLSNVGLVLECRDSRVPLTSANPLLENSLSGRDRIVVYTKSDLCAPASATRWMEKQRRSLGELYNNSGATHHGGPRVHDDDHHGSLLEERSGIGGGTEVLFTDALSKPSITRLLSLIKARARHSDGLTGLRALVVGMPNAGKSTLLNALRREGMRLPKAAQTGAQPGVTRKLSTPVRVVPADEGDGIEGGVFVVDTPGVFVPYVGDVETMLKLSLVGCVKDGLVPAETVADYLLFQINLRDPGLYADLCGRPTNDVREFLAAVATRTGKLNKGGVPSEEQAADWVVQQWRKGNLGRFGLDDVSEEGLRAWSARKTAGAAANTDGGDSPLSMNQARRREKEARKARSAARRQQAADGP